ncbi:hypothetical protein HSR122_1965 [Halapricum desulfuricans]|uniref:Uncharacterized protein n=1 Tax=Halapricum desulfuricans TaxID=2841257 RepID=A0A897N4M5_9EURY|nr:hypothetical protein HSR122_1965 [Halapricum desulfuricans]
MTETQFTKVAGLGELHPDYWSELLSHPETTIEIQHCGKPIYYGNVRVSRPRVRCIHDGKEYSAKISIAVETTKPHKWRVNE